MHPDKKRAHMTPDGSRTILAAFALATAISAPNAQEPPSGQVAAVPAPEKPLFSPEDELHWYWRNGLRFGTLDRRFDLKLGGLVQFDGNWIGGSDELEAAVPGSTEDGTEFRRLRLSIEGKVYADWYFRFQPDFAGGTVRLTDAYVGRKELFAGTDVQIGQFREPMGLEELQSKKYMTFVEKALPIETFAPSRNDGLAAHGAPLGGALQWTLGVFRANTDDFGFSQEDGGYAVTGRVGGTPLWKDKGRQMLHVGLSLSHRDEEQLRFRTRPEVHLSGRFVDTGTIDNEGVDLSGLELAGVLGPVHGMAEYLRADVEGAGDPSFDGWYSQVGWFLTGEVRPFKRGEGLWDRIDPQGAHGAVELAARYSTVDLSDGGFNGGRESNVTLAVNWYLNANLRAGLNYVRGDLDTPALDEQIQALLLRVQFDW